jgi:hypothetical protein
MAATFPTTVRTFTPKVDVTDTVYADHVNVLQEEVRATEQTLGESLLTSTYAGTFAQTGSWATLSLRLANIEAGLVGGVTGSIYFKKSGDTVTPDSGSIALGLKTTAGSANLLETRNAANTLRFVVDYDGIPKVGTAAVLYVGSAAYTTLNTTATAANTTAQGNPFNPFLLAGI